MDWPHLDAPAAHVPLTRGYRFELLQRAEVGVLTNFIATWMPDIGVGSASVYLRPEFYQRRVVFPDQPQQDVVVLLLKRGDTLAGMFSCQREREALSIHARLGIAAPRHRGANLAQAGMVFTEAVGRLMGLGVAYGMATLKTPHAQQAFERAGWQLVGIMPGFDREQVAPGVVKRVFEALYAKVLVERTELLQPDLCDMTPRTQALYRQLHAQPESAALRETV